MCVTVQSSLIDHGQVGHTKGTGLWSGSVCEDDQFWYWQEEVDKVA